MQLGVVFEMVEKETGGSEYIGGGIRVRMNEMTEETMSLLMARFLKQGGKIDKYYLRRDRPSKRVLVNLHGWFGGKDVREAINKAIAGQKVVTTGSAGST